MHGGRVVGALASSAEVVYVAGMLVIAFGPRLATVVLPDRSATIHSTDGFELSLSQTALGRQWS